MKDPTKRYDAWANPILSHSEMVFYYRDDKNALAVLNDCMPHMYVVIPDVQIRIYSGGLPWADIVLVYPGGTKNVNYYPSERALEALRRTYRKRKGWTREITKNGLVILSRKGTVIRDSACKFGIHR